MQLGEMSAAITGSVRGALSSVPLQIKSVLLLTKQQALLSNRFDMLV